MNASSTGAIMILQDEFDGMPMFTLEGDWVQDIRDMHEKFGVREIVDTFDKDKLRTYLKFRLDMLQEELDEAQKALAESDADGIVDALIDGAVFAIGTLDVFHVDAYEAWARVHEKNMEKSPGVKPNRPNPFGLPDLIKPEGWTAPTHEDNVGTLHRVFD
jgi:predicted HAD superfamily Cof-like phosphohydrolase